MKINDVLEGVNKILDEERALKNIDGWGHFVAATGWERKIGTEKIFHVYIDFVNKHASPHHYVVLHHIEQCPNDNLEKVKDKVEQMALQNFFRALRLGVGAGSYENLLKGEFEGWN